MKFPAIFLVAALALIAMTQESDGAVAISIPQRLEVASDCTINCKNCVCKSRTSCAQENIVNLPCPGSYIFVCCRQDATA